MLGVVADKSFIFAGKLFACVAEMKIYLLI
jgi:hypothetical protein